MNLLKALYWKIGYTIHMLNQYKNISAKYEVLYNIKVNQAVIMNNELYHFK